MGGAVEQVGRERLSEQLLGLLRVGVDQVGRLACELLRARRVALGLGGGRVRAPRDPAAGGQEQSHDEQPSHPHRMILGFVCGHPRPRPPPRTPAR